MNILQLETKLETRITALYRIIALLLLLLFVTILWATLTVTSRPTEIHENRITFNVFDKTEIFVDGKGHFVLEAKGVEEE